MKNKAVEIVKTLRLAGFQAVFAGGCVRDMLLGIEPKDYDIATNALPEKVESLFKKTIAVGKAFGVIVVILDECEFEVATFRSDGQYLDGRHPDSVTFATMEEDAERRDLTINGMFYDPIEDKVIDYVDGQLDLKLKVIRLIGNPEDRIREDKLRMMRVLRFAVRFGFEIDDETIRAVKTHAQELDQVSQERVTDEFLKILRLGQPKRALNLLEWTGLLKVFLPEIVALRGVEQPPQFHPEGDCWDHSVLAMEHIPKDASDELLLGCLFHDIGKPACFKIRERIRFNGHDDEGAKIADPVLRRMKLPNETVEQVVALVYNHMKFMHVKQMRISRLKRFIRLPKFEEHMALHKADCMSSHKYLDNYNFVMEKKDSFPPEAIRPVPFITGKDLISLGFAPGPKFKTILTDVEDRQLEGTITDKEGAMAYVGKVYIEGVGFCSSSPSEEFKETVNEEFE